MNTREAIKFLESLKRQAEYRRTQLNSDPMVAQEAAAIEGYIRERVEFLSAHGSEKRTRKLQPA